MNELSEERISCPYCGESISLLVDSSESGNQYIEDCQVCCRPIEITVWSQIDGSVSVTVETDSQ